MTVIDGKAYAREVEAEIRALVQDIIAKTGKTPVLATILVGNNPASVTYVRMKGNACSRVGMLSRKVELPESTTTQELLEVINRLNRDPEVCGILLQHPVPAHIDERACFDAISLEKDVDGVTTAGFGRAAMGLDAFCSATPLAIVSLLKRYNIPLEGKEAVVIGRSPILGKPVAALLLNENATVTIAHSKTRNLPDIVRRADIVVAAVGKPLFVKEAWIKEGAVLMDAGYNAGNVGDIDLEACIPHCSAYTPVPGGVGPVTIAMLMKQTAAAAQKLLVR
ncbi:MAG: bifunctional 5,10-methylene-tetrahydrofolate dehydrogenase/5,10-methylene-tetrahydrofolate cyclohydrolase [Oscillospiraceae bacterium]|nr:MAG: bifunctional 5,10-methylene-tetrahydrofolate dehydrogenase/5,10-methylene-tetrahydrofolate cyclohydrolase [Oscillospiraceae bacterium]